MRLKTTIKLNILELEFIASIEILIRQELLRKIFMFVNGHHHLSRGTPILCHVRDEQPESVSFQGQKSADGCKFLPNALRMGHNLIT